MYNVMDDFRSGRAARQESNNQNYIADRRAIEDPYKDAELKRVNDARNALVAKGVEFGDPDAARTVQTTQFEAQKQPGELAQQAATLDQTKATTDETKVDTTKKIGDETRAAALRGLDAMEALNPKDVADLAQRFTPSMAASLGINPQAFPQLLEMAKQFPDMPTFFKSMRDGFMGQEKVTGTISGYDAQGKPITINQGDRDKAGVIPGFSTVDQRAADDAHRLSVASAEATRALGVQRLTGKPGATTPEQAAAQEVALFSTIDDMRNQLNTAVQSGAIPNSDTDVISNLWTGDNPIGRFIGSLTGDKKEEMRRTIDDTTTMLLTNIINAPGMSSRLFDTEGEKKMWRDMLGGGGSYGARWAAIDKFQRWAEARLADPSRLGREDVSNAPTGGATTQQPPVAGGNLQERADGVYQWTPGTD